MDAYGNLTSQDEFSGGRRIRLVSYLGQDLAVGATGQTVTLFAGIPSIEGQVSLHHLSAGDPGQTAFVANAGDGGFTLGRSADPTQQLAWEGDRQSLGLVSSEILAIGADPTFTVTFVDGCWFTLNNADRSLVLDCAGSGTAEGQPLLAWEANGGDNQKWRAQQID